jgi:hypothetical protein
MKEEHACSDLILVIGHASIHVLNLFNNDMEMRVTPRCLLEGPNQIKPLDHEWPHDGDHLERLGWQMGLSSIVLAPFIGAYDLLGVGYGSWPVEALPERVFDESSWPDVVSIGPTVDVFQQPPPLFGRDAALQELGVTLFVEFSLNDGEGLSMVGEPSDLCLVH